MEAKGIETGGPAFPSEGGHKFVSGNEIRKTLPSSGISVRDYFAAKAMQAMVNSGTYETGGWDQRDIAIQSYQMADAMLAERTK